MAKDLKFILEVGEVRVGVDTANYTLDKVEELREKVSEIRINNSPFSKYPMEEGETREKWSERVSPIVQEEEARKEGESSEDHLKRIFTAKNDAQTVAFEIFKAVTDVFNLRTFSKEEFKKVNWIKLKKFLYDVLDTADIPASEYYVDLK